MRASNPESKALFMTSSRSWSYCGKSKWAWVSIKLETYQNGGLVFGVYGSRDQPPQLHFGLWPVADEPLHNIVPCLLRVNMGRHVVFDQFTYMWLEFCRNMRSLGT